MPIDLIILTRNVSFFKIWKRDPKLRDKAQDPQQKRWQNTRRSTSFDLIDPRPSPTDQVQETNNQGGQEDEHRIKRRRREKK